MPTVIERLRDAMKCKDPTCLGIGCFAIAMDALPALLALADAVESKDPARIESALAELKKEAQ